MTSVEYGIVTGYTPSLKTVGYDITFALNRLGYPARCFYYQLPYYDAKRYFSKAIIFIPFDPIYFASWGVMARDYFKAKIPNVIYTTVEGKPKEKLVYEWLKSDLQYVACSQYVREMLELVDVPVLDVIPHGVNLEHVSEATPQKEYLKSKLNAKIIFGTVASTLPRKGLKSLARAIKIIKDKVPNAIFYIYSNILGENPFFELPNVYVDSRFGKLSRVEILSLIGSFDFYICPSYSEGFGLPLLEAHALGVPVICGEYKPLTEVTCPKATLYFSIQETVERDDGYGLLFTYHIYNENELAEKIIEAYEIYMNDQDKYREMCEAGRKHAEKFNVTETYRKFIEVI